MQHLQTNMLKNNPLFIKITHILLIFLLFTTSTIVFSQPLSGNYIIGSGNDYNTFTEAVNDLMTKGISSSVIFQVNAGTYTERIHIGMDIIGASINDTVKFISATGNASDVLITNTASSAGDNFIVTIDSADYITFEKMTFTSPGSSYCTIFNIRNEAKHINIKDNIFNGGISTTTNFSATLINCDQYSIGENKNPDSILVSGNTFNNGGTGIYVHAYSLGGARIENFDIINNIFKNQYYRGIYARATINSTIKGNTISSNTSGLQFYGIHVSQGGRNYLITHNNINVIRNGEVVGMQIDNIQTYDLTENIIIANNMVSLFGSTNVFGIETYNCGGISYYFNSVTTKGGTAGIAFFEHSHYSNDGPVNIVNNIFQNKSSSYAAYIEQDTGTLDYMGTIDYNDYYTAGTNLAFWGTTDVSDLSALQALNGQDNNSVSKEIAFVSETDLHLLGDSIGDKDLIGTPVTDVSDDIDNEIRNASFPYMGADENTSSPLPVELISFAAIIKDKTVVLNWITATECNNYGFEIERKEWENNWEKISFVKGNGTTNTPQCYTFIDNTVRNSENFYRLKQIDTNGTFSYSKTVEIEINIKPNKYHLTQNYPNPFNPSTMITYSLRQTGNVQLLIFNEQGKLIRSLVNTNQVTGDKFVLWDGKDKNGNQVSSGVYFYTLKADGNIMISNKMIKLK